MVTVIAFRFVLQPTHPLMTEKFHLPYNLAAAPLGVDIWLIHWGR